MFWNILYNESMDKQHLSVKSIDAVTTVYLLIFEITCLRDEAVSLGGRLINPTLTLNHSTLLPTHHSALIDDLFNRCYCFPDLSSFDTLFHCSTALQSWDQTHLACSHQLVAYM